MEEESLVEFKIMVAGQVWQRGKQEQVTAYTQCFYVPFLSGDPVVTLEPLCVTAGLNGPNRSPYVASFTFKLSSLMIDNGEYIQLRIPWALASSLFQSTPGDNNNASITHSQS